MLQLHGEPGPALPLLVRKFGPAIRVNRAWGWDGDALLDPEGPPGLQAVAAPRPRLRRQCHVAVRGPRPALHPALQRVRAGPRVLRAVRHGTARKDRGVPGPVPDEADGGTRAVQGQHGGGELWRVRGLQPGRAVPRCGREARAVLHRGVPGG